MTHNPVVKVVCLNFSLEMSKLELAEHLLCIRAKVNGHRLQAGTLDEVEHEMQGIALAGINVIGATTPLRPARNPDSNGSQPIPSGLTIPNPVITAR